MVLGRDRPAYCLGQLAGDWVDTTAYQERWRAKMSKYGGFHSTEYLRKLEGLAILMSREDAERYLFVKTEFSWVTCKTWVRWLFSSKLIM